MESLYSRFLGLGFQNKVKTKENYGLSKSNSMPFYQSFQARKLPTNLSREIPFKKRNDGITSSDIKVQMLEEKIRNLENQQIQMIKSFNENNGNTQIPVGKPEIMPIPLLILNNNDSNNYNNNMSRTHFLNNELQASRLKFEKYRGLQKQDYTPNIARYSPGGNNKDYISIFNRQKPYNTTKSNEEKYNLQNNYINEEIKNTKIRNKARKFVNKLDEEIYSPIQNDFQNYMNNVNKQIQQQLKEDNIILNRDIDKMENDFNDIKIFLNEKLQNMEIKQKSNFEKLKNVIRKVGGSKMSKSIQNVFEGKNYDLQKAEEEHLVNEVFNLPNIIDKKMTEEEMMNIEREKRLRMQIEERMNEEFLRKREIEELKHQERLKMLEIEKEKERIENLKTINMLRYQIRKEKEDNYNNYINNLNNMNRFNMSNNLSLNDISRIFFMKKMKNMNNNGNIPFAMENFQNMGTDEILKYMLLKNMGFDNNMNNINNLNLGNNFDNNNGNNNFDNNNFNYNINNNENFYNINNNKNDINELNEEKKSIIKDNLKNSDENIKEKFSTSKIKKEKISRKLISNNTKKDSRKSKNSNKKQNETKNTKKSIKKDSKKGTNNVNKKEEFENKKTSKGKKSDEDNKNIEKNNKNKTEEEEDDDEDEEKNEEENEDDDDENDDNES